MRRNFGVCAVAYAGFEKGGGQEQARSQDLKKGGGYFERVRSVQTTLTRIFIDLESVSDGLSET